MSPRCPAPARVGSRCSARPGAGPAKQLLCRIAALRVRRSHPAATPGNTKERCGAEGRLGAASTQGMLHRKQQEEMAQMVQDETLERELQELTTAPKIS